MPERRAGSKRATRAGTRPAPRARPAVATRRGPRSWAPPASTRVRVLFVDVDGTLTDGRIVFSQAGDARNFWVRDGIALEWARDLGVVPVAISGRASAAVVARMEDLKLEHYLGAKDKVTVAEKVLAREGATWEQCVMVGDDLPDVPLMRRVGWAIAVGDAHPEVKRVARTVVREAGGLGAVREVVERVLKHNGVWSRILDRYGAR